MRAGAPPAPEAGISLFAGGGTEFQPARQGILRADSLLMSEVSSGPSQRSRGLDSPSLAQALMLALLRLLGSVLWERSAGKHFLPALVPGQSCGNAPQPTVQARAHFPRGPSRRRGPCGAEGWGEEGWWGADRLLLILERTLLGAGPGVPGNLPWVEALEQGFSSPWCTSLLHVCLGQLRRKYALWIRVSTGP